jgi:hypothetical protein
VIAISNAVRNGQLNLACGPFLVSYLYKGHDMIIEDVRLVQGVICGSYFGQFAADEAAKQFAAAKVAKQKQKVFIVYVTSDCILNFLLLISKRVSLRNLNNVPSKYTNPYTPFYFRVRYTRVGICHSSSLS